LDKAKVLLIPAPALEADRLNPYFPIGLYSIKAVARSMGYEVDILDLAGEIDNREFSSAPEIATTILSLFDPTGYEIIGLSTVGGVMPITVYLLEKINLINPGAVIILGGPHASSLCEEVLKDFPMVDAAVVGEGEVTFTEMMRTFRRSAEDWQGIPGVMIRNARFQRRELIRNLDELPLFEYDPERYKRDSEHFIRVEALRGCFSKCKFCSTTQFWQHQVRRKSPARLLEEITYLSRLTNIDKVLMLGDNFSTPIKSLWETCDYIAKAGAGFKWGCALRIDDLEEEDLKLMKDSGCYRIFVGVESASQTTLNRIGKKIDLANTIRMIEKARNLEIEIAASHIVGFPWETEKDVIATLELHSRLLDMDVMSDIVELHPLPGAEGFPESPIITDFDKIKHSLPVFFRDEYSVGLMQRFPQHFIQFGYYETPNLRRSFVLATVRAAQQVTGIKSGLRRKLQDA
jgi:anaerobic magnesium-protoporphyrin IX monomethyl ester cyclase